MGNKALLKWIIAFSVIISFTLTILTRYYGRPYTIYEFIMSIIADRLNLSIAITLPALIITVNQSKLSRWEMNPVLRMNSIYRWHNANLLGLLITILIYVLSFIGVLVIIGFISGFSFNTDWTKAYSYNNEVYFIDAFDKSGQPFINLINSNTSPIICLLLAVIYLAFRCLFYGLVMFVINLLSNKAILGFLIATTLNYFEVNFYNMTGIKNIGILPFENSIVTSISGIRPSTLFSFGYWILIICVLVFISYMNIDNVTEKFFLNTKHDNKK